MRIRLLFHDALGDDVPPKCWFCVPDDGDHKRLTIDSLGKQIARFFGMQKTVLDLSMDGFALLGRQLVRSVIHENDLVEVRKKRIGNPVMSSSGEESNSSSSGKDSDSSSSSSSSEEEQLRKKRKQKVVKKRKRMEREQTSSDDETLQSASQVVQPPVVVKKKRQVETRQLALVQEEKPSEKQSVVVQAEKVSHQPEKQQPQAVEKEKPTVQQGKPSQIKKPAKPSQQQTLKQSAPPIQKRVLHPEKPKPAPTPSPATPMETPPQIQCAPQPVETLVEKPQALIPRQILKPTTPAQKKAIAAVPPRFSVSDIVSKLTTETQQETSSTAKPADKIPLQQVVQPIIPKDKPLATGKPSQKEKKKNYLAKQMGISNIISRKFIVDQEAQKLAIVPAPTEPREELQQHEEHGNHNFFSRTPYHNRWNEGDRINKRDYYATLHTEEDKMVEEKVEEDIVVPEKTYKSNKLSRDPKPGDILAYRKMEIGLDRQPSLSKYKEGEVIEFDGTNITLLHLFPPVAIQHKIDQVGGIIFESEGDKMIRNERMSFLVDVLLLQDIDEQKENNISHAKQHVFFKGMHVILSDKYTLQKEPVVGIVISVKAEQRVCKVAVIEMQKKKNKLQKAKDVDMDFLTPEPIAGKVDEDVIVTRSPVTKPGLDLCGTIGKLVSFSPDACTVTLPDGQCCTIPSDCLAKYSSTE